MNNVEVMDSVLPDVTKEGNELRSIYHSCVLELTSIETLKREHSQVSEVVLSMRWK